MHVGYSAIFQGFGGTMDDKAVYDAEVRLASAAEPMGYESIWGVEHHFTNYTMCPDIMQWLSFMAGRTEEAKLGSMVMVLPWHNPLRAAEQISMADNLSDGRLLLGLGRGTGKVEFDAFGVDMPEARQRFAESAEAIFGALETGVMEYEGTYVKQPRAELHPAPFKSFRDRTYAATVSPESAEIMAQMGVGVLVVPQKPWNLVQEECETYRNTFLAANGTQPPAPICAGWTYVADTEEKAEEGARKWMGGYWDSIIAHYEFDEPHLKDTPGYEFHGQMYDRLMAPGGMERMTDFYIGLQPWGTPDTVYEKIKLFCDMTGSDSYIGVFRYAGMPEDEAAASMKLFADEVMPGLKDLAPAIDRLDGLTATAAGGA